MDSLSTMAVFDDLRRSEAVLTDGAAENEFFAFVQAHNNCRLQWTSAISEAQRLQRELDTALANMADLETKLYHARRIIEMEKKHRKDAEYERDLNEKKISHVRDLVQNERAEMKDKFAFLNLNQKKRKSGTVFKENEMNSTGSLLSDLSVTQSEDDFLEAYKTKKWKKHRPSLLGDAGTSFNGVRRSRISTGDKRKSNNIMMEIDPTDKLVAHTKVSIPQGNEPIQAESIIEAIPMHNNKENCYMNGGTNERRSAKIVTACMPTTPMHYGKNLDAPNGVASKHNVTGRQHVFASKTLMISDTCNHCQKKMRFGSVALKCRDCRIYVHPSCKDLLSLVCVPSSVGTPIQKGLMEVIGYYAPSEPPMIPAIIVHCVHEIERRGFTDVGIYRVSGSEKEIKALKERFLRGKSVPSLGNIDIHVLCGCIKDFLRGLREPLIPTALWKNFSNAEQNVDSVASLKEFDAAINKLPRPNRDTLAFLILHFLKIANCEQIKMPASNIAKVFGPTLVGYSSLDPDQHAIFTETMIQANVLQRLLDMPAEYWSNFLIMDYNRNRGTPIMQSVTKKKFYATPPYSTLRKK